MYIEGKACWLNQLVDALEKYDNRVDGKTNMTPFEMSTNQKPIPTLKSTNNNEIKLPKFKVGDFVRVPDERTLYSKGYTFNWNREHFKIH